MYVRGSSVALKSRDVVLSFEFGLDLTLSRELLMHVRLPVVCIITTNTDAFYAHTLDLHSYSKNVPSEFL